MMSAPRRAGPVSVFVLGCALSASLGAAQEAEIGDLTVAGAVREPGTRDPVPGERVELIGPRAAVPGRAQPRRETISDQDGRFLFESLPPGRYTLDVPDAVGTVSDRQRTFELALGLPPDIDLWSHPRAFVSGRVTDADGNPVATASVALVQPIYSRGRWGYFSSSTFGERTDADGRYEIAAPPGRYYLQLRDFEAPTLYYPDEVDLARAAQVTLGHGTVIREMNFVRPDDAGLRIQFAFPLPDARGRYEIPNVLPGRYQILAIDLAGVGTTILFWEDPAFLRDYAFRGEAATVEPGEQLTLSLVAVPLVD